MLSFCIALQYFQAKFFKFRWGYTRNEFSIRIDCPYYNSSILSSQSCHVERLKVLQAGAHAYIGHPYSLEECLAQAQALMQLYCDLKPQKEVCYTLAFGKTSLLIRLQGRYS